MGLDIIGAGFGRTGTFTQRTVLADLGFSKCYHMADVFERPQDATVWHKAARGEKVDWNALFTGYRAMVDWPGCQFWKELADFYPEAKVLLSIRDPEKWYTSISNTILPSLTAPPPEGQLEKEHRAMAEEIVLNQAFGGKTDDKAHVIDCFHRHIEEVKAGIDPDRLLVYDVVEGWDPLCKFLNVPVPDQSFPHTNTTEDFKSRRNLDGPGKPEGRDE